MAEPPALPSFSFDDLTASQGSSPPAAVHEMRTAVSMAPPVDLPILPPPLPGVAPMAADVVPMGPGSPTLPLGRQRVLGAERSGEGGPAPAIHETVDEVLHHTSEQTVRLVNLEDKFREIGRSFEDLREEMHAGFMEMRQLVEQTRQATFRVENQNANQAGVSPERLTARLDSIEDQSLRTGKRHSFIVGLTVAQTVLLALAVAYIALSAPESPNDGPPTLSDLGPRPETATAAPSGAPIPTFGTVPAISTPAPGAPPAPLDKAKLKGKKKR